MRQRCWMIFVYSVLIVLFVVLLRKEIMQRRIFVDVKPCETPPARPNNTGTRTLAAALILN